MGTVVFVDLHNKDVGRWDAEVPLERSRMAVCLLPDILANGDGGAFDLTTSLLNPFLMLRSSLPLYKRVLSTL